MRRPLSITKLGYDELAAKAHRIAGARGSGHLHTTPPGCLITGSPRRAIVLGATDEGAVYGFFDDQPIEDRAKPLAILLHGADSVPDVHETLEPASAAVNTMAERMRAGRTGDRGARAQRDRSLGHFRLRQDRPQRAQRNYRQL